MRRRAETDPGDRPASLVAALPTAFGVPYLLLCLGALGLAPGGTAVPGAVRGALAAAFVATLAYLWWLAPAPLPRSAVRGACCRPGALRAVRARADAAPPTGC